MKKRSSTDTIITTMIFTGTTLWVALVIIKKCGGLQHIRWSLMLGGALYIPLVLAACALLVESLIALLSKIPDKQQDLHTYRALKDAMHGMTLNTLGPIYGVERRPGETNRCFERRILHSAIWGRKAYVRPAAPTPKPATGDKLDEVAKKYNIKRQKHESDKHLQGRVREAVMKRIEGGEA